MKAVWLLPLMALGACQPLAQANNQTDLSTLRSEINVLKNRVSALEQRGEAQERSLASLDERVSQPKMAEPQPTQMNYELSGFGKTPHQYPTRERCEAAKQALLDAAEVQAREIEANGGRLIGGPSYACVPI